MSQKGIRTCPMCNRTLATDGGRFSRHTTQYRGDEICRMTEQYAPVLGQSATDYMSRAYMVADLAEQIQDRDTAVVWDVLTAVPAAELQRLLMLALAAVPIDKSLNEIYAWVCDLPASRKAATA